MGAGAIAPGILFIPYNAGQIAALRSDDRSVDASRDIRGNESVRRIAISVCGS